MSQTVIIILLILTFIYYLSIAVYVTYLAVRSGRLKHFKEITPGDIALLFDGIDHIADRHQVKKGGEIA